MKRVTALTVVAVLGFAGVAEAQYYLGKDLDPACGALDCGVSFTGHVKHHRVTTVRHFVFEKVPIDCDNGHHRFTSPELLSMRVKTGRKFHGKFHTADGLQFYEVSGQFSKTYRRASGTLHAHGDFGSNTNCDTGEDDWSAKATDITGGGKWRRLSS
jgi:hypothetical protein